MASVRQFHGGLLLGFFIWMRWSFGDAATPLYDQHRTPAAVYDAISETADKVIQHLGLDKSDTTISNIDMTDAKIGQTLIYEFDIEVGGVVLPLKLSEDIKTWKFLTELPASNPSEESDKEEEYKALIETLHPEAREAVLDPFQLAGPVELWIQDAKQLRLAVPHDVEAGVLKRVLLADGAVVTVTGARELSLARPLQFPLPLTGKLEEGGFASSLLNLASRLRYASQRADGQPLLSLRVVGPTSLVAAVPKESDVTMGKLKVKRLAPGSVELVARQQDTSLADQIELFQDPSSLKNSWVWPLPSLNHSDARLISLEQALRVSLGPTAYKKGAFKLLRARASAASFLNVHFELEKKLSSDAFDPELWPDWVTKPSVQKLEFEVTAKVEGDKIFPLSVRQLDAYTNSVAISSIERNANVSFTKIPPFLPMISPLTLDLNWEGVID